MITIISAEIERACWRIVLTALVVASLIFKISPAQAQGASYQASNAEIAGGPPGSVIRDEPMGASPPGGIAHRVLYRSTSPGGKPIAVSGVIIIPPAIAPASGWPIVAWSRPTTGIVPRAHRRSRCSCFKRSPAAGP